MGGAALAADPRPGRCCPTDYRYRPEVLRAVAPLRADVLWVVGGLYGNTEALRALNAQIGAETAERVVVVANGDFHWFDAHLDAFGAIEAGVAGWHRLRGNVETELARADADGAGVGCGCAYPEDVPDADVDRSNAILARLRATARRAGAAASLGSLPMLARAQVGEATVGIVHGDDRSLAGWRLAADRLAHSLADGLPAALDAAAIDLLASSHTCLPVACTFEAPRGTGLRAVINNGAAGMANFAGSPWGVATRIARAGTRPPRGLRTLYRAPVAGAEVAAVAVEFDLAAWLRAFDAQWPAGSPAERSYRRRIVHGPDHRPEQAALGAFASPRPESPTPAGASQR
jgi:hypothetical protein